MDRYFFRFVTMHAFDRQTDRHLSRRLSTLAFHAARKKRTLVAFHCKMND